MKEPNSKAAWAVGATAFLTIFAALCACFDPTVAYGLSLVATLAVKA
jgi:hypothetical protein